MGTAVSRVLLFTGAVSQSVPTRRRVRAPTHRHAGAVRKGSKLPYTQLIAGLPSSARAPLPSAVRMVTRDDRRNGATLRRRSFTVGDAHIRAGPPLACGSGAEGLPTRGNDDDIQEGLQWS